MNKAGDIAGPRVLEHIVDVVLYMEVGTFLNFLFWIVGKASTELYCTVYTTFLTFPIWHSLFV